MSMRITNNKQTLNANERGFASIVIALTLIVILALLTVGFAQLARHEQQGSLDKQQANQAYYAAESGINDAVKDITSGAICDTLCAGSNHADTSSTTCMTATTATYGTRNLNPNALTVTPTIDQNNGVSYSCLLVDLTPDSLDFSDTAPDNGQYLSFQTTQPLSTLSIEWGSGDGQNNYVRSGSYAAGAQFPPKTTWKNAQGAYAPVVLFGLTPVPSGAGALSQLSLANSTFNAYLYPESDTGSYTASNPNPGGSGNVSEVSASSAQGQIVPGNCGHNVPTIKYACSVTISNLSAGTSYLLHYIPYYDTASVHITGTDINGHTINFIGQAQIDVTGKSQNVLKRVQVTLAAPSSRGRIGTQPLEPDSALQGQNICKRFDTYAGSATNPDTTPIPGCGLN